MTNQYYNYSVRYKQNMKIVFNIVLFIFSISTPSYAGCEMILEENIGWTILSSKTIAGYKDTGKNKKDDFEGCEDNRIIYFMDGTYVTCNSYGYQYAYMPKAIILGRGTKYKGKQQTLLRMVVGGDSYDVY